MRTRRPALRARREVRVAERWLLWLAAYERFLVDFERASRDLSALQRRCERLRRQIPGELPQRRRRHPRPRAGMTVREAAAALDVSETHLRRLLRRGDVVGIRAGAPPRWRLARRYVRMLAEHRAATGRWPHAGGES